MKKIEPHWLRVLKTIGNSNILFSHIMVLESRILDIELNKKSIETNPDYFCWLFLYSTYVCQKLEHKYYRHNPQAAPEDKISYLAMIQFFNKKFSEEEKKKLHFIYSVLELRDFFVHFGMPNLVKDPSNKGFIKLALVEANYKKTRDYFIQAVDLLKTISDPVVPIGRVGQIGR